MRFSTIAVSALSLATSSLAKEMEQDQQRAAELFDSRLRHSTIMNKKIALYEQGLADGKFTTAKWPRLNYTKCVNGVAEAIKGDPAHTFKCKNTDLYDFINHHDLGSPGFNTQYNETGSGSWGWTDPSSGREFVAIGQFDGTSLLEILPTGRFSQLGYLPVYSPTNNRALWKELRGYKSYILIGSELEGHGVQIFDMRKLLTIDPASPVRFNNSVDLTGHFADLPRGRSHNVVINEELEYGVAVGAAPTNLAGACRGGLKFFSLKDPSNPVTLGCDGQDGYVHDAQCLVYRGPHTEFVGRDICYGYNEDTLTIYDVTNKTAPTLISRTSYEGASYTHQGQVTDPNWQEFLIHDDEYDEEEANGPAADGYAVTYIWDIRNLRAPKQTGIYKAIVKGIDHNQYIKDNRVYQSSYSTGLRVYDISSIPSDPTGNGVWEIAHFDMYPEDDNLPGGGVVDFFGTWSSYAMFKSGFILINDMERGAFLVKINKFETTKPKNQCNADNCLRSLRANTVKGRLEESQAFCSTFTKTFVADVSLVKDYAVAACTGNVISRVSSACSCLPTATSTA